MLEETRWATESAGGSSQNIRGHTQVTDCAADGPGHFHLINQLPEHKTLSATHNAALLLHFTLPIDGARLTLAETEYMGICLGTMQLHVQKQIKLDSTLIRG